MPRWEKEIELRREEVQGELSKDRDDQKEQIEDRDSMQHSRLHPLNSFDNITTCEIISTQTLASLAAAPTTQHYPPSPHQHVLFVVEFKEQTLLQHAL